MFKKSIVWTNFADGKTVYEMFKDYGITKKVKEYETITYVRFNESGDCLFCSTHLPNSTEEKERRYYNGWIKDEGYTELKMFNGDKEYVGTI